MISDHIVASLIEALQDQNAFMICKIVHKLSPKDHQDAMQCALLWAVTNAQTSMVEWLLSSKDLSSNPTITPTMMKSLIKHDCPLLLEKSLPYCSQKTKAWYAGEVMSLMEVALVLEARHAIKWLLEDGRFVQIKSQSDDDVLLSLLEDQHPDNNDLLRLHVLPHYTPQELMLACMNSSRTGKSLRKMVENGLNLLSSEDQMGVVPMMMDHHCAPMIMLSPMVRSLASKRDLLEDLTPKPINRKEQRKI